MASRALLSTRLLHSSASTPKSRFVWDPIGKQFIKRADDRASPRELAAQARLKQQRSTAKASPSTSSPSTVAATPTPQASTSKKPVDTAAARKRFQERKYIRGQDDSTLKVSWAGYCHSRIRLTSSEQGGSRFDLRRRWHTCTTYSTSERYLLHEWSVLCVSLSMDLQAKVVCRLPSLRVRCLDFRYAAIP